MQIDLDQLERILPTVRTPGRYVGAEYNSVVKEWDSVSVRLCLAFPDIYDLGMSNLGLMILYDILNGIPDVLAERAFLPWVDMIAAMRKAGIPLYSLENKRPLPDFDIIGVGPHGDHVELWLLRHGCCCSSAGLGRLFRGGNQERRVE